MEFVNSEKGKKLLLLEKYKFGFQKTLSGDIQRWTCTKRKCTAYMKLHNDSIVQQQINHNHEPDTDGVLARQTVSNNLKRKGDALITEKPSKMIRREITSSSSYGFTLTQHDLQRIRKNLNAERLRLVPKLPTTLTELHDSVSAYPLTTNLGENFLYDNDPVNNIITITCTKNLEALKKVNTVFVDGTFKSCPKQFLQLFTVFIKHQSFYVPVVFNLLPNKTTESYGLSLAKIKNYLSVSTVFADFEVAIHNAVRSVCPDVKIHGCRFHLTQSWWRKIQEVGLVAEFKNSDGEIGSVLRLFFGLPLLPPEEVQECFLEDLMALKPVDRKLDKFCDYVLDTYIVEDCQFPPKMWAKFDVIADTTTNCCESFHGKLNSEFTSAHPNIFLFMETLKSIQCETYVKLRSVNKRNKTKKQQKAQDYIKKCMEDYKNKTITRVEYVKKVSFKFMK